MAGKCEHGMTTRECYVCASAKYASFDKYKGYISPVLGDALDALASCRADWMRERERAERLETLLKHFVLSIYPVAPSIDERGYSWCEAWLDEARINADKYFSEKRAALAADEKGAGR